MNWSMQVTDLAVLIAAERTALLAIQCLVALIMRKQVGTHRTDALEDGIGVRIARELRRAEIDIDRDPLQRNARDHTRAGIQNDRVACRVTYGRNRSVSKGP